MRPSVRRKLLVSLTGIMLIFATLLIVLNGTLLESYYVFMEKRMLRKQTSLIEEVLQGISNDSELSLGFEQIEKHNNLSISIFSADGSPRYFTRIGFLDQPFGMPPDDRPAPQIRMQNLGILKSELLPDGSTFEIQSDVKLDVNYMTIRKSLDDGGLLDVRVMLSSIERGAAIASTFTIYAVGLALIAAVTWAIGFSRRFTQPLVQMNSIARSISELDFSRRCQTLQDDELGQLGSSINELSDRLSVALEDLKTKNALLESELERERQLDRMRKEFVANVSHELRTPISVILGYADGLKMNIAQDEEKRNYYSEVIVDEAERMNRLVSDLLELSKYESGSVKLAKSRFNLDDMVSRIAERCLGDDIRAITDFTLTENTFAYGDERRLEQVLINFLNNAVEHLAHEGRISVAVEDSLDGSCWILKVTNDGEAIPEDCLPYIWDSLWAWTFHSSCNTGYALKALWGAEP
jgi:two-component system sensor histidine kinase VanS